VFQRHMSKEAVGAVGVAVGVVFGFCVLSLGGACGEAGVPRDDGSAPGVTTSALADGEDACAELFGGLAESVAPVRVYGLQSLPQGWSVAPQWWPAITLEDPSLYEGEARANPLVSGAEAGEPQIQLVLEQAGGWLVIVENFRGDVGEVRGELVGAVAGNEARLYQVNGGMLVQWSDGGRWYGVFGRGIPERVVVETALAMKVIDPT